MSTKKKDNLVQQVFHAYSTGISRYAINKYAASYQTLEDMGGRWRFAIPYTPEIEADLILRSNLFIRTLPADKYYSTNLQFLSVLTNKMAAFLREYTFRSPNFDSRPDAYHYLQDKLFNNSEYIAHLRRTKAMKRAHREIHGVQESKKRRRIAAANAKQQYDNEIQAQVRDMFCMAKQLRQYD